MENLTHFIVRETMISSLEGLRTVIQFSQEHLEMEINKVGGTAVRTDSQESSLEMVEPPYLPP